MRIIADTSGVLTLLDADARHHAGAHESTKDAELIISPLVLAEIDYMISARRGAADALAFAREVRDGTYSLAPWDNDDHGEAVDVANQYRDMNIGLADASNVVLALRYQTTQMLTLDGHFRAVKPLSGDVAFTLLPADN